MLTNPQLLNIIANDQNKKIGHLGGESMAGHFTEEQQNEIREKLFRAGIEYLKTYGVQKMTVDKLAAAAGIAKGSFYNFYKSKEEFLFALSEYAGNKMDEMLKRKLGGREKLTAEEFTDFLREYLHSDYDLMASVTIDDFLWMRKHLASYHLFEPDSQVLLARYWMGMVENVNKNAAPGVIVNLVKCIYAMREHRNTIVQESLDDSIELVLQMLEIYISGKGESL